MGKINEKFDKLVNEVIDLGGDKGEIIAWKKIWEFLDEEAKNDLITNLINQKEALKNISK